MHSYLVAGAALALATAVALGWKWQLGVLRTGTFTLAIALLVAIGLTAVDQLAHFSLAAGTLAMWLITVLAGLAVLLILFFRDPDRAAPAADDIIVSPADGHIVYLRRVPPHEVPAAEKRGRAAALPELAGTTVGSAGAVSIGISMNLSDVHVNRAPLTGRVEFVRHVAGTFGSLRKPETLLTNERATTVIDAGDVQIALVQIASRLVRRIVSFVSAGEVVRLGQRTGIIRLGSQVDVLIPDRADIRVTVQPGDQVTAGRTTLALITSRHRDHKPGVQASHADAWIAAGGPGVPVLAQDGRPRRPTKEPRGGA